MLKQFYNKLTGFFFNYPTPSNLSNLWNFGVLSFLFLIIQIVSGLFLSMYYIANDLVAFLSVEYIMRDVSYGWFFRYVHSNGASFFFLCVYIHLFRSLYYFSFTKPRLIVWNIGVIILFLMIITAFTGYVLPWGQMSFWAATVITNLASAVPFFGDYIVLWLWGSFSVSTYTLNRFFTFHFILPFIIFIFVILHFIFLHKTGSSNSFKFIKKYDKTLFHPLYSIKDYHVVLIVLFFFFSVILISPNYLSHSDNYIPADPLSTPEHIVPEWYFLLFYAMLRSIPSKLGGIIILLLSIAVLFIFPFFIKNLYSNNLWNNDKFNYSEIEDSSAPVNGWESLKKFFSEKLSILFFTYFFIFVLLSYIGMKPIESPYLEIGRFLTALYFLYFFLLIYFTVLTNLTIFEGHSQFYFVALSFYSKFFKTFLIVLNNLKDIFWNFINNFLVFYWNTLKTFFIKK